MPWQSWSEQALALLPRPGDFEVTHLEELLSLEGVDQGLCFEARRQL
jgi:hypothetical protein